jgi:hypothetical protein
MSSTTEDLEISLERNWLGADKFLPSLFPAIRDSFIRRVTEMVVADDAQGADASFDQELSEDTLDLGLARLEVVTTDERFVLLGKLDTARNKGVLGRAVDKRNAVEDTTNGKDRGGSNFRVALLDALQEIFGGIIDTRNNLSVAFGVGGPNDDDLVQSMLVLECLDVVANVLDMSPLVVSGDQVVGTGRLIGGDKGRIVDGGKGLVLAEILGDLTLKIPVEDFGTGHRGGQVEGTDVPSSDDKVVGMDHGKDCVDGRIDIITIGIDPELHGRRLGDAAVVIRLDQSIFGVEAEVVTVGGDGGS